MKILITGANGQLGQSICNVLDEKSSVLGLINPSYYDAQIFKTNSVDLDITKLNLASNFLHELTPDLIINCAAYTDVDGCEKNYDKSFTVNSIGPRNLAIEAEKIGAKLIHISTDYVFSSNTKSPYKEYDLPSPIGVYGKTKLLGEKYVQQFCNKHFIVRTSWLYSPYRKNFVKSIIKAAKEKGKLKVVNDQVGNPTNAEDLVYHILHIALTEEYGIYHCTGNGECSWYDFANKIVEYANISCLIEPTDSKYLDRMAERPEYSSLDNLMLRYTIGDKMRNWEIALEDFIKRYKNLL